MKHYVAVFDWATDGNSGNEILGVGHTPEEAKSLLSQRLVQEIMFAEEHNYKVETNNDSDTDYVKWYVDEEGNLRADAYHHDGENHYLYRAFKKGTTEEQIEDLTEKIYNGEVTQADIEEVTERLGGYIGKVYGWSESCDCA